MKVSKESIQKFRNRTIIPDYHQKCVAKLKANNWEHPKKEDYQKSRGVMVFLDEEAYQQAVSCWNLYRP